MKGERGKACVQDMWKSNGRPKVQAYTAIFFQHLAESPVPKVGAAAVAVVWQAFLGSMTVLAVVALCFYGLDFLSGVFRALRNRNRGETLRWERAGDGFVKLGLYFVMWQTGVLMDVMALETTGINTRGSLAAAALGVIILMEVTSIADNVTEAIPAARPFFERVLSLLPAKSRTSSEEEWDEGDDT